MATDSIIMKKVNPSGVAPTADEIADLENAIGHKIPKSYIDLISNPEAAFPAYNFFPAPEQGGLKQSSRLPEFIRWQFLRNEYKELNTVQEKEDEGSDFPPLTFNGDNKISGFLPIARTYDSPQMLVCLNVDEMSSDYGAVYFTNISWDFGLNELVFLASSLQKFMDSVQPTPELTPKQLEACARAEVSGVLDVDALVREVQKKIQKCQIPRADFMTDIPNQPSFNAGDSAEKPDQKKEKSLIEKQAALEKKLADKGFTREDIHVFVDERGNRLPNAERYAGKKFRRKI